MTLNEKEKYWKFTEKYTLEETYEALVKEKNDEWMLFFCDELIDIITNGYIEYFDKVEYEVGSPIDIYIKLLQQFDKDENPYYSAFKYLLLNDFTECEKYVEAFLNNIKMNSESETMHEDEFLYLLYVPFKNAYQGFWKNVGNSLRGYLDKEVVELCYMLEEMYAYKDMSDRIDILLTFIQKYPDLNCPKELLGFFYYFSGMWNNAIAYLENIDEPHIFSKADLFFRLGIAYGKLKDYAQEETYYRKVLNIVPAYYDVKNCLGYSLYCQKKYQQARIVFEECLSENRDLPYSANNYVRTLIALKRNKDAKDFVRNSGYKIAKNIVERVKKLDSTNKRLTKEITETENSIDAIETDTAVFDRKASALITKQQFSSEKILEDELTNRIESGISVFGKKLKVYKRKGEYGRQYVIPIGRLDLLCEDEEGNLYVIELKKDSGYDDAYIQLSNYLDWFEHSKKFKGNKVSGIICLNNPTEQLIEKVHKDSRMKLYEYQISYTEI